MQIVLFRFKDSVSLEKKKDLISKYEALADNEELKMKAFEWGKDVSIEGKAEKYSHAFLATFGSEADRTIYVEHPVHQAYARELVQYLDQLLIIDYLPRTVKADPRPFA